MKKIVVSKIIGIYYQSLEYVSDISLNRCPANNKHDMACFTCFWIHALGTVWGTGYE